MHAFLARFAGMAHPLMQRFDLAALAKGLGHNNDACVMRAQGKCPGKDQCCDCAWSENTRRMSDSHR